MNAWPLSSPMSWIVQMLGWFRAEAALRFAAEALQSLGVLGDFFGQELQSDKTIEPGVLGLVDHTHPAAAELLDDAVVRDGLAEHLQECYGVRSGMSIYGLTATSRTCPSQ